MTDDNKPRWAITQQPPADFLRATLELEAIMRTWRNGFEFTPEKLEQYGRASQIVWDTVNEVVHIDGVTIIEEGDEDERTS